MIVKSYYLDHKTALIVSTFVNVILLATWSRLLLFHFSYVIVIDNEDTHMLRDIGYLNWSEVIPITISRIWFLWSDGLRPCTGYPLLRPLGQPQRVALIRKFQPSLSNLTLYGQSGNSRKLGGESSVFAERSWIFVLDNNKRPGPVRLKVMPERCYSH